ncbi:30S ribosomal protein S9 [Candidatus Uhrbacteria bacterium CG_4_10_14_0_2_um_filter_41_7]|uniref:Small ribosomal subunit protein uS9 n=1 Tax=Candidatus Uhrbacteria bacterium CG_4_9_14_3_um_filter_41_35 TaxID=1975034 RepID=A0A2M7XFB5_9BACT|nr:MAG: 30S ribosomal protein S9 [Candidatus Uhrbacteria bacterium CG11_big_fil_rev_8_21_14_0_20_41_9]PIZ55803.1 MAG: 30S ribosomal protein S9 [Candidatus Uhrbacteria bacterium CG_4_10_14_0_2_um_filter_41_7]PJA46574.1 MAG: 30S ribosomal protein S9 [Candidatus Uhrbacteria bacterium CG_4_9_14_3_um_filter_41_35]
MAETYVQAIGRRKEATAQVRLYPAGTGKFSVNDKELKEYFHTAATQEIAALPLIGVGKTETVDITVRVLGGGMKGQADAVRLGVARALVKMDEELKAAIKATGLLTRDARVKERKKPGLRKARRSQQWRKR